MVQTKTSNKRTKYKKASPKVIYKFVELSKEELDRKLDKIYDDLFDTVWNSFDWGQEGGSKLPKPGSTLKKSK